jgi:hypothetical protein
MVFFMPFHVLACSLRYPVYGHIFLTLKESIMRTQQAFWRDTLVTSLRDIRVGEQMLKQKSIQREWPQFSIILGGIQVSRRRVGDIIQVLGGMEAAW